MMRLRQVALVAKELHPVVEDLCAVLGLEVGFNDPGVGVFGLHNAVIPVGKTFLEVVSPVEEGTSAGRLLERRNGDGGYMVILQVEDLAAARERVTEAGVRIVWETTLDDIATIHLHPRDVGAAILSIDWAEPWDSWRWGGPHWPEMTPSALTRSIVGADLQADDPGALAASWSRAIGAPVTRIGSEEAEIVLDEGSLLFHRRLHGRPEGVAGLEVAVTDIGQVLENARKRGLEVADEDGRQPSVQIGGARFRLRG